jgi:hypothetical protein
MLFFTPSAKTFEVRCEILIFNNNCKSEVLEAQLSHLEIPYSVEASKFNMLNLN